MTHLFIHGLGQTAAAWDGVLRHMAALPDVRGVNLPPLLQGRKADYETLSGEFDALCGGIQGPLALCGLSLGAVLALDYTLRHPERVDSLALIAPQYRMPRLTLKLQSAAFRRMPERAFASTGFRKAEFLSLTASMAALDFSRQVPGIACRTLLLVGEKDRANRKATRELAELIPGAEFQSVPGAGHEANLDAPEALAAVLSAFYRSGGPGSVG